MTLTGEALICYINNTYYFHRNYVRLISREVSHT